MAYATGKVNATITHLYQSLDSFLQPLLDPAHALSKLPVTVQLQRDLDKLDFTIKQHMSIVTAEVDPFMLRNQVAAHDESKECDVLQSRAEQLLTWGFAIQPTFYIAGLLLTHFGIPWAISIPATLLCSAFGT